MNKVKKLNIWFPEGERGVRLVTERTESGDGLIPMIIFGKNVLRKIIRLKLRIGHGRQHGPHAGGSGPNVSCNNLYVEGSAGMEWG